jgi:glycosyltransferase involved in cell wall biosynthesis
MAWMNWLRGKLAWNSEKQIRHTCRALGLAETPQSASFMAKAFRRCVVPEWESVWRDIVAVNPRYDPLIRENPQLTRSVILKGHTTQGEKGVLLTYFEYNLARVLALPDDGLAWLDAHYHLVFVASWSPTDYAILGSALLRLKSPLFIQCANQAEREKLSTLHPRLVCLPGLACDWVDPALYDPIPQNKRSIDLLMVANWGAFKRHWEFFEALTSLPRELRVVFVGQREGGRDKRFIEEMARDIGVPQNLRFFESLSIEEVTALQCDARISVILSRREGGCVAAVESLFAGCALAMRADAHIGSSAHINRQTGLQLRPGRIAEDLGTLISRCADLRPEDWAIANIRNDLTLARINAVLRDHSLAVGQAWTSDLAVPRWRPHPTLAHENDQKALRPFYENLHQNYPDLVRSDLMEISHR